jgi:LuxR family transcriptional regulator, maltose regulon positive regulatory protein
LELLADGCTNREIAGRLFIALGTVKADVASVYRKLGVHSRAEAVSRARDLHLLQ